MTSVTWQEKVLQFWKQSDAFQQSIESRSPALQFTFFDGPPFTSGDPHYGHLLQSVVKDMVPRWMTMRGYRVSRKWGWDCHGIPAENYVNKKLGISSKKEVEEEFGIRNYIEECRAMVSEINDNWSSVVNKIGRWVDMENAYFTMSNDYMESVIHVFSDLYHNDLIYKGFKVLGYSWALGTALSNSEIAEGYEMRQDPAVTVTFPLKQTTDETGRDHEFVAGIIQDKDGRQLMLYHHEDGRWFYPGGKREKGENPVDALQREIEEELGTTVAKEKFLGGSRFVHKGKLFTGHFFSVTLAGEPTLSEDTHSEMQRIKTVPSTNDANELGYAIKVGDVIVDDSTQIRREFMDRYFLDDHGFFDHREAIDAPISLLAWTTTPWTLPSNMFAAVGPDIEYTQIYDTTRQSYYILASSQLQTFFTNPEEYVIIKHFKGGDLVGLQYEALFSYYYDHPDIDQEYKDEVHRVLAADFVTTESGTGIAHEAPAFGEDDYNLVCTVFPRERAQNRLFDPIDAYGDFTALVPEWEGTNVIESNKSIVQALKDSGRLFKYQTIDHSYPHCPRTKTPLIYKAIESWFLKEDYLKAKTVPRAEDQYFVPDTVKKRFSNGLASAPDWNISRTRFWGCPLPVWENPNNPDERVVVGSIAEIYALNSSKGQIEKRGDEYFYTDSGKLVDLHRPYIDDIILVHPETGNDLKRIPEVLDCWFESGSMPYGQIHWMKHDIEKNAVVPTADFIAEGLDQTRGRFRALHVIGNAYIDKPVFQNVLVTGLILAEDGKKMSKSLKNYPDPNYILDEYGADPLRLYMLGSPVVKAEPLRFNEQGVEQMLRDFVIPLENVWNFLKTYAEVDGWADDGTKVWFMRHAHCPQTAEESRTKDTPLSDEGRQQIASKQFLETVARINPDIVLCNDFVRVAETASGVQKAMEKLGKSVKVIVDPRVNLQGFGNENASANYQAIRADYVGMRVLIVSHKKRYRILRGQLLGLGHSLESDTYIEHFPLDTCEVVPLPATVIDQEIDQWIYAELHTMMLELNEALESYTLEPATRILTSFIEKLTNWYVRRSRRRFWAEGMEADKRAAYHTLWHVLETFLLCAAPFVPFVTEKIWLEMKALQGVDNPQSLHLQYRPIASQAFKNEELIDEVTTVRKIIKGALYIRAKNKIKVKQPLAELSCRV